MNPITTYSRCCCMTIGEKRKHRCVLAKTRNKRLRHCQAYAYRHVCRGHARMFIRVCREHTCSCMNMYVGAIQENLLNSITVVHKSEHTLFKPTSPCNNTHPVWIFCGIVSNIDSSSGPSLQTDVVYRLSRISPLPTSMATCTLRHFL